MQVQLRYRTLVEVFNQALNRPELAQKDYLEIVTNKRQESLTFGQLGSRARGFAAYLIGTRGVRPTDKIAILGSNRADWDIAFWGAVLAGAVPVLIDPERRVEGVKKHLLRTDVRLLVMADDYQDARARKKLKAFLCERGADAIEMTVYEKPNPDDDQVHRLINEIDSGIQSDETAVILCTSGTTGEPREVEVTHTNLIANVQGVLKAVTITGADRLGHIMPPCHSFGLTVGKLIPLWVGATNIYTDRFRQISKLIKDEGITIFIGVPALFTVLARQIEQELVEQKQKSLFVRLADRYLPALAGKMMVKKLGWGSLRFFVSGSAAVPKWVLEVFWKRTLQLREGYGTTENSPVYGFNENRRKLGSAGRPIPTLMVKIVDEKNRMLRPGEKGEILLGGPCVVKGYHRDDEATQEVFKTDGDGIRWLHTGDLGCLDKDGYLFITGRKKHIIVLPGGKNVNPELLELVLSRAQYVNELLVVPGYGKGGTNIEAEAVKAIVRPAWEQIEVDTKLTRRDLISNPNVLKDLLWQSINKCQQESEELASFEKVPSKNLLEIKITEFRKTSTGKIKRGQLH
jgi:long-chain acyl-CoA synthetase